jgi:predicted transcriptional regulator
MPTGKQTHVVAVSLPKALFRELEQLRQRQFRKRSEVVKEAVRQYIERHRLAEEARNMGRGLQETAAPYDDETMTEAEDAAFRRGEEEYRRGEYLTLEELRAHLRKRPKRNVARRRR